MKPPVLLRPAHKSNKPAKPRQRKQLKKRGKSITCEQPGPDTAVREYVPSSADLLTGCDPAILPVIHAYLEHPLEADRHFLNAWEKIGRQDAHRVPTPLITRAARTTVSALGLACLIRYARGYEDEHQVLTHRADQKPS